MSYMTSVSFLFAVIWEYVYIYRDVICWLAHVL